MAADSGMSRLVWWAVGLVLLCSVGVAHAQLPPINAYAVGRWDEYTGQYSDVWGDGDYAYLPNWRLSDGLAARVHVIDISDPTNPVLDETLFIPAPNDNASAQDVKVANGLLFVALEGDFDDSAVIYDVRDPAARALIASIRVPTFEPIHNLFYDSGYLYLADSSTNRVAIVDLTTFDPDNPPAATITQAKWIIENVGSSFVHDVTVRDGRLYAAAWDSGLWIYDVTDVANTMPTFLGSVAGNNTHSMWPTDDGKFVVTGEERSGGGIQVYEITDNGGSLTLTLRDSFVINEASSVHNQVFVGNRLYNSWYEAGLQVFDVDPVTGELDLVARLDTRDDWGIYPFLGEDKILLSDMRQGLIVANVGPIPLLAPTPPPAPHNRPKNRYLSFYANNPGSVSLRVSLVDSTGFPGSAGVLGWVGPPDSNGVSRIIATREDRVWNRPVIHVADCGVVPAATYAIEAIPYDASETDEANFGPALLIDTAPQPAAGAGWADCVGPFGFYCTGSYACCDPNVDCPGAVCPAGEACEQQWPPPEGFTNFNDVQAAIRAFQAVGVPPDTTWVDLHGAEGATQDPFFDPPNYVVNFSDVQQIVISFQGGSYPYSDPSNCP